MVPKSYVLVSGGWDGAVTVGCSVYTAGGGMSLGRWKDPLGRTS